MTTPLVQISQVTKAFNKEIALHDISAVIPKGQIIALAGPDGAGKTTLIRLIAGLLKPTSGTITVAGYDTIKQAENIHRIVGYMPQKFGLYEDLSVIQNLNLYADLKGVKLEEREETFKKLLSFTALNPFQNRLAGDLSGGMKQKLGLACTLLSKPELLLLDEPSVGVDPISRRELWKMVMGLLKEGISVLWSTAYLDEASMAEGVILLNSGKKLFDGPPQKITKMMEGLTFKIPNVESPRRLLREILLQHNVIDGVIQGADIRFVTKEKKEPPIDLKGYSIEPVKPRFEDAYIKILGGGPGGGSLLADKTPEVPLSPGFVIEAKGLTKKFGSFTAADHITFDVKRGEIFGLLGPNGAGKSTTFKMMCGLLKPTQGEAYVCGLNLQKAPSQARSRIGYMAQKFSLYGDLSVKQNLDFFSGAYNLYGQTKARAISEMIDVFNLSSYIDTSAGLLPLGYKQRLALSCSLMHNPEVLFLDEPTSGVDPITRREFWNHINGLVEKGVTVMVTTHFLDEAEYCDRIALIYRSQMIEMGTPAELKKLAKTADNPDPTLEDGFIQLIHEWDQKHAVA